MIIIEAKTLGYIANVFHDQMDNGMFVSYNGTNISILSPTELNGAKYTILHQEKFPDSSIWKSQGQTVRFKIDQTYLQNTNQIFIDAIELIP